MGAFKKIENRYLFIDMTDIKLPHWMSRGITQEARFKTRLLKKIDPLARCSGQGLKFRTPEELRKVCDRYFKEQETLVYDKYGKAIRDPATGKYLITTKPLTISGLAMSIGIGTQTLKGYRKKVEAGIIDPAYGEVLDEALQRIESYAERRIYDRDGSAGGKFVLQAGFDWESKKERTERKKIQTEEKIALEKLRMQQKEHELRMKLLQAGIDTDEDSDINITITRARKED